LSAELTTLATSNVVAGAVALSRYKVPDAPLARAYANSSDTTPQQVSLALAIVNAIALAIAFAVALAIALAVVITIDVDVAVAVLVVLYHCDIRRLPG
jgi:hypothetical protein